MANDGKILFSARVRNTSRVKSSLAGLSAATSVALSSGRLERLLLRRTLERFQTLGANRRAQKSPEGDTWARPTKHTMRKRKLSSDSNRALFDTGALMDSISVLRSELRSKAALASPTGAGFSIGVQAGSPAEKYARLHQFGGRTKYGRVPARRYLGISAEDVKAVEDMLLRIYRTQGF